MMYLKPTDCHGGIGAEKWLHAYIIQSQLSTEEEPKSYIKWKSTLMYLYGVCINNKWGPSVQN